MRVRVGVAAATAIAMLALAAPALAGGPSPRFAAPTGSGPEPCLSSNPCSLQNAVNGAPAGANVLMTPGTYSETTILQVDGDVDLRGQTGSAADVVIDSTAGVAVQVPFASGNTELEDFTIEHDTEAASPNYGLHLEGGIARRLFVDSSGESGSFACHLGTSLLRDSICVNTSITGGRGAGIATPSAGFFSTLTNVTTVATSPTGSVGLQVFGTTAGANPILTGQNVIAEGALFDQRASAVAGATADINLFHSNFDTFAVDGSGTTTSPTENDNQSDPELLDANYRQLPDSPTIDAGDNGFAISAGDIDGDTRIQGDAVDIGADEFESTDPSTTITKKPPKKTQKKRAKFKFTSNEAGAGFECKLDKKPYKACDGGKFTAKRLKTGKHKFRVRAEDASGNTDPSPAKHTWKVRKKRNGN